MRNSIFCFLLFLAACGLGSDKAGPDSLVVDFEQVALKSAAGTDAAELTMLEKGDALKDLGKVSNFESGIRFADSLYQAPWIYVETSGGKKGWVFAAALHPSAPSDQWLTRKRMLCYFGSNLSLRYERNVKYNSQQYDDAMFADQFRASIRLRDTFLYILHNRPMKADAGFEPDFYWLGEAMQGFVYQYVTQGELPYLFVDYKYWQSITAKTKGQQDDLFIQCMFTAYPIDSIESFLPVWTFPLSTTTSASQLGSGAHLKMLQQIDQTLQSAPLFAEELEQLKDKVLDDIVGKNRIYWQPPEKIVEEMTRIQSAKLKCLQTRDLLALEARRKMFEDPEANHIKVNARAGI